MPAVTVTIRQLKNQDTGIDLSVPNFKETKGLLQSNFDYNVVVVSKLPVFKTAKHKEADVIQFMVTKRFADFEDVHTKLNTKFSGTVLPPLPKKALIVNENVARERRGLLDHFLKSIACTPKMSTSSLLLEFLGVSSIKAGKYRKDNVMVVTDKERNPSEESEENKAEEEETSKDNSESSGLFDEDDNDKDVDDLFAVEDQFEDDLQLSSERSEPTNLQEAKLFDDQDLGGAFTEGDAEDLLFVPGAAETTVKTKTFSPEENSDLFEIQDNLDELMQIQPKKQVKDRQVVEAAQKANQKPKPAPRNKPNIAKKPSSTSSSSAENIKPAIKQKPQIQNPKPSTAQPLENTKTETGADNLDSDDIMKYIQQNTDQMDDIDLFS